jgi:transcriptional regulator with XRE-family HTH domain
MEDRRDQQNVALGRAVRHLRKEAGLTQQLLARVAEVPIAELRLIEHGGVDADWGTIRHLAKAMDTSLVAIFQRMEDLGDA